MLPQIVADWKSTLLLACAILDGRASGERRVAATIARQYEEGVRHDSSCKRSLQAAMDNE